MNQKEKIILIFKKNKEIKNLKNKFMSPMQRKLGIRKIENQIIGLKRIL